MKALSFLLLSACLDFGASHFVPSLAVSGTRPQDGATGVPVNTDIEIFFAKKVDPQALKLTSEPDSAPAFVSYSTEEQSASFRPAAPLSLNTTYTYSISGTRFSFTTRGQLTAPSLTRTTPAANATNVSPMQTLMLSFSQPMSEGSLGLQLVPAPVSQCPPG